MSKTFLIFCFFAILDLHLICCKQTLTELIYGNQILEANQFEQITLSQLKIENSSNESNNTQSFSKLQLDNKILDEGLELLIKQEEYEKQNKTKTSRKLKSKHQQSKTQQLKAPIPEENVVEVTEQINNETDDNNNSTGILSSIFHSVTNYLFENGTGAFFQLKQFNQNSFPNDQENEQKNTTNNN